MARTTKDLLVAFSGVLIACVVAIALQLVFFSPSSHDHYLFPPSSLSPAPPSNGKLQEVIKLGEGLLKQPEDVAFDKNGVLYTATRDGWIKRLHRNGSLENWWQIDSENLLGLTVTKAGDVVVCDLGKGLLKVTEEGVSVLTSHVNGAKIMFADEVIESSDGTLYFSDLSTKISLHDWQLILEETPEGQLLKYDPSSKETTVVLDGLAFPNGVALSPDQDYLVVCETLKYRCLKYWLEGDSKGETEIFVDNLPGRPDNINLAPDGSFWIALIELQIIPSWPRSLYTWRVSRYLLGAFPELRNWAIGFQKNARVVNVATDGKIIRGFDDPTGTVMAIVTSAVEFEGNLYFGSLHNDFVGKLPLTIPPSE